VLGAADALAKSFIPDFVDRASSGPTFACAIVQVQVLVLTAAVIGSTIAFASASVRVPELTICASFFTGGFTAHATADFCVEVVSIWAFVRFA